MIYRWLRPASRGGTAGTKEVFESNRYRCSRCTRVVSLSPPQGILHSLHSGCEMMYCTVPHDGQFSSLGKKTCQIRTVLLRAACFFTRGSCCCTCRPRQPPRRGRPRTSLLRARLPSPVTARQRGSPVWTIWRPDRVGLFESQGFTYPGYLSLNPECRANFEGA